jgi:hypothetical protein
MERENSALKVYMSAYSEQKEIKKSSEGTEFHTLRYSRRSFADIRRETMRKASMAR